MTVVVFDFVGIQVDTTKVGLVVVLGLVEVVVEMVVVVDVLGLGIAVVEVNWVLSLCFFFFC